MSGHALFAVVRRFGNRLDLIRLHPHAFRHSSITQAMLEAPKRSIGVEEVLKFSRHSNLTTLLKYRDQLNGSQGKLADVVADQLTPAPRPKLRLTLAE
jgi:integrase